MKVGDLVSLRGSPWGARSFRGIILGWNIHSAKGDNKAKYFDVLTTSGKIEVCHSRALEVLSEAR